MIKVSVAESILPGLAGTGDGHLKFLEGHFQVEIAARGGELTITGDPEKEGVVAELLREVSTYLGEGHPLSHGDLAYAAKMMEEEGAPHLGRLLRSQVRPSTKKSVSPRSPNQQRYLQAMNEKDMVFGIGPAGTGKTYLAVAMALAALRDRMVERIILTRPAVEAGERLGFLPGDMAQKVEPYLRPLYDAIFDFHMKDEAERLMSRGIIEIAPLAFMRGRTLNDSFIILDEAQNTTTEQMKMFVTRIGFNSKAVITGDVTQIDLPAERTSGLVQAEQVVKGISEIAVIRFNDSDVVRHPLVQRLIVAYEAFENGGAPGADPHRDRARRGSGRNHG